MTNTRQLLACSLLAIVHGAGFLFLWIPLSPGQRSLPDWLLNIYSVGWLAVGIWGALCATVRRNKPDRHHWARLFIAAAMVVWASIYAVGWLWFHSPSAWFGLVLYLLVAWIVADPPPMWFRGRRPRWTMRCRDKTTGS